jgi:DNA-binding transcriptional regulator YiaG
MEQPTARATFGGKTKQRRARGLTATAELLKAWRDRHKYSQSAAALKLKVSKRTLQNWEQGHREPIGFALRGLKEKIR